MLTLPIPEDAPVRRTVFPTSLEELKIDIALFEVTRKKVSEGYLGIRPPRLLLYLIAIVQGTRMSVRWIVLYFDRMLTGNCNYPVIIYPTITFNFNG